MTAIAAVHGWPALLQRCQEHMVALGAHPAQTVVLLPFFQLQTLARQAWAEQSGSLGGFAPRFETTTSWHRRLAPFIPDELDLSFDAGWDALRARGFLRRAGLGAHLGLLTPRLVQAAQQLGTLAACVAPAQRAAWAQSLRGPLLAGGESFASHEAALAQIALEWAAASRYASDVLLEHVDAGEVAALVVVRGLQPNTLAEVLARRMGERALFLDLPQGASGELNVQKTANAQEEAEQAAACVLAHLDAGRAPVALPAVDRLVTRRISAMLSERGVALLDETGWKLSTTRAAASVLSLLRAAAPLASPDDKLQWLKACPTRDQALARWEQSLRKGNSPLALAESEEYAIELEATDSSLARSWRSILSALRQGRAFSQWLHDLGQALQSSGQWTLLQQDAAGQQVLEALRLGLGEAPALSAADDGRMSLSEFSAWVQWALEGASFKPDPTSRAAQVVILPLAQLAARPFAAVVLAGADEQSLPAAPELPGDWSAAQRVALGLPSRDALALEQRQVWRHALQNPRVDVFWRAVQGETRLQASPLLQAWLLEHTAGPVADARPLRQLSPQVQARPAPSLPEPLSHQAMRWSASSYADLRSCPYRFFALRGLGLQEAQELDEGASKREFGAWLHAVLDAFHRQRPLGSSVDSDRQLLERCAAQALQPWQQDVSFVPFAASWPPIREAYLEWLGQHEALGWRFESSELVAQRDLSDGVSIRGRLDRVDVLVGSGAQQQALIDYKTESLASLKARVADPLEDTQLVFYAALLGRDSVQAFYVGLGESKTQAVAQKQVSEALPLLLQGLQHDAQRIRQGEGLPALGEGKACDYCAARGLCRKDFWRSA